MDGTPFHPRRIWVFATKQASCFDYISLLASCFDYISLLAPLSDITLQRQRRLGTNGALARHMPWEDRPAACGDHCVTVVCRFCVPLQYMWPLVRRRMRCLLCARVLRHGSLIIIPAPLSSQILSPRSCHADEICISMGVHMHVTRAFERCLGLVTGM